MRTTVPCRAKPRPKANTGTLNSNNEAGYTFASGGSATPPRQEIRQVKARDANPLVGHSIIDIEAVRRAEIVAPVDAGGEHDVGDGSVAFLRQLRCQHRLHRTIADDLRMLLRENHYSRGVAQLVFVFLGCSISSRRDK